MATALGKRKKISGREDPPLVPCSPDSFARLGAVLLMLHSWYKDGFDVNVVGPVESEAGVSLETKLMWLLSAVQRMLIEEIPRRTGNGWAIKKFHELRAIPRFVGEFGHPSNFEASTGERDLQLFAKECAEAARKGDVSPTPCPEIQVMEAAVEFLQCVPEFEPIWIIPKGERRMPPLGCVTLYG